MTLKQVYEALLVEMNKVEAPSLLLPDFNYLVNKAVLQYINTKYNIYDANQQTTDDLRVLKATAILPVKEADSAYGTADSKTIKGLYGATYETELPPDYLHMLNCVCIFKVNEQKDCWDKGDLWNCGATRLTSDMWPLVINNFYMRPSYRRPYYFIHNVNTSVELPTNSYKAAEGEEGLGTGTDTPSKDYNYRDNPNLSRSIKIGEKPESLVEKNIGRRFGNASTVRCEIRYGKDNSVFELQSIHIDYLKSPQHLRLTQTQLDSTRDTSQMMEFPDYVCQEIINGLVKLVMENSSDPRLQTNIPVNQTIAPPAQLQSQQQTKK